jgi:hypothetical protein
MKRSVGFLAIAAALLLSAAAQANTVTIVNGAAEKGTLRDLGITRRRACRAFPNEGADCGRRAGVDRKEMQHPVSGKAAGVKSSAGL